MHLWGLWRQLSSLSKAWVLFRGDIHHIPSRCELLSKVRLGEGGHRAGCRGRRPKRGADRQGSMRADGGGFTAPNRCQPIAELPLPLAAHSPMKIPPTSGLDDLATPVLHSPERALDGTTSLTGRTARALFRSNPGRHASGCVPDEGPASQKRFHTAANARGASAGPAAHPTQVCSPRMVCVSTAAIYPVRPVVTQPLSAICHNRRNCLLRISITTCFGTADTMSHP